MTLQEMVRERFNPVTRSDYVNALKQVIQELALTGLWRAKFFEHGAFYGGTALRILYGLPRFSEDLDFTLLKTDEEFDLSPYFQAVKTELKAWGFEPEISGKPKATETLIESAFIKARTKLHLLKVGVPAELVRTAENELLKVKFEVDTTPPHSFETEVKYLLRPVPCNIKVVSLPQMFAGKVHAVLCRNWRSRVKGRDWYDLVWFVTRQTICPLACLESRMRQSGHWQGNETLTETAALQLLKARLDKINLNQIRDEAMLFVNNPQELEVWSKDFFEHCFNEINWEK
jgi:predicted nucleotidyltransferase component of viral defense system